MSAVGDLRVLLRFGDFRRLLVVRLLSQLSDGVYQVALAAYVVFTPEKQASAASVAAAMAVLLLPYSVLGPFVGVLLDRWRRRQVLLRCNLLRAVFAAATAGLILARVPDWLFYLSALAVTGVNRFVLAGLSAALPRVVDGERLVIANSLSPTAGTIAATLGGGAAFVARLLVPPGTASDALVVGMGAVLYLAAGLSARTMAPDLLGPDPGVLQPRLRVALASTARGLAAGLRHLAVRRPALHALAAVSVLRFCYGALTVTLLMLCRYAWSGPSDTSGGLALLGLAVGLSGAGFFVAAVITPSATGRFGTAGWITVCALSSAVLEPALGLPFSPGPMLAAAFVLGVTTQGAKIATDTVVQTSVDDAFRGRVFSLYDVLFNVAFVGSAAVAALVLPPDGRSATLVVAVAVLYAVTGLGMLRARRRPMFHVKHAPAPRTESHDG
jgi:MFS family permease